VFINPEAYYECASFLKASDFYIHRHKWIWEAFTSLVEQRQPIDLLTISNELDRRGQLAEIGGPAYLTALVNQVPSSLNAESYAQIVKDCSVRRKMIDAANRIAQLAYNDQIPLEEAVDNSYTSLENAVESAESSRMRPVSELMSEQYDRIDQMSQARDEDKLIIHTQLIDLDRSLRIRPGNLITIAGRPGMGKTGLGLTIASNVSIKRRKNVALFVLEMSNDEIADRLAAMESDINLFHLMDAKLEEHEWPMYTHAVETVSSANLFVNDDPDITVPQIRAHCKKLKARFGLDLVVIDYMGLIEAPGENRVQQVSYISRQLKKMAKALAVPVIALHQMNRDIEHRGDGEPVLSDLRDSGSVEQDSDSVLFLYVKDEAMTRDKIRIVKCSIAKQRNGPKAKLDLAMHNQTTKFDNAATVYVK